MRIKIIGRLNDETMLNSAVLCGVMKWIILILELPKGVWMENSVRIEFR